MQTSMYTTYKNVASTFLGQLCCLGNMFDSYIPHYPAYWCQAMPNPNVPPQGRSNMCKWSSANSNLLLCQFEYLQNYISVSSSAIILSQANVTTEPHPAHAEL